MSLLVKWTGSGLSANTHIFPDVTGRGDTGIKRMIRRSAAEVGLSGSHWRIALPGATNYSSNFDEWLKMEDFASQRQRLEWRFTDTDGSIANPITGGSTISKYSMRFYFKMGALPVSGQGTALLFAFLSGDGDASVSNYAWAYHLSAWDVVASYRFWMRNKLSTSTVAQTTLATGSAAGTTAWRCEIQVDASRAGSKVFCRVYPADSTTISTARSLSGSPSAIAADRIYFGDGTTSGFQQTTYLGRIEIHDDFTLGGEFAFDETASDAQLLGATGSNARPFIRDTYHWYEWDGTDLIELSVVGTKNGSGTADTADTTFSELEVRDVVPPAFTEYHHFTDLGDTDNAPTYLSGLKIGVIYPSGTAPTGGWPVAVWWHSGFGTGGSWRDIPREFVNFMLSQGIAVASPEYRLGQVVLSGGTYPSYPTASQYPHHIQDGKNAVTWLKSKSSSASGGDNTYPLNAAKVILMGYSFGGYIALGIGTSRGLASDGSGNDLRMTARSSTYQSVSGAADPDCIGVYVWGAPISMKYAADNDNTDPNLGFPATLGGTINNGIVVAAAKAFVGKRLDQSLPDITYTGIPNFISLNSGNLPPSIGYARGSSDQLVKAGHVPLLEDALDAVSYTGLTLHTEPGVFHDVLDTQFSIGRLQQWFDSLAGL